LYALQIETSKKMKYSIKGKGGQGVLFLARIVGETLLLSGVENFSFLKEFDEGQRSGEIKVTFNLPFSSKNKKLIVKEHNIIELKKVVKDLNLNKNNVKKALRLIKPNAFKQNIKIWEGKTN